LQLDNVASFSIFIIEFYITQELKVA